MAAASNGTDRATDRTSEVEGLLRVQDEGVVWSSTVELSESSNLGRRVVVLDELLLLLFDSWCHLFFFSLPCHFVLDAIATEGMSAVEVSLC